MSLSKSDLSLVRIEMNDGVPVEEDNCTLYNANLLEQSNNFEDWMKKAGVDCFFSKKNPTATKTTDTTTPNEQNELTETETQSIKNDKSKLNVLRTQNSKIDKNMNSVGEASNRKNFKSDIFMKKIATVVEVKMAPDLCSITIKDPDGNKLFLPQCVQTNQSSETASSSEKGKSGVTTHQQITSINFIDITNNSIANRLAEAVPQILTNAAAKFFLCPVLDCQKAFHNLPNAKIHALKHMGIKPFKCDMPNCNWEFYTQFKLARHKETHAQRKLFQCPHNDCNRHFTTIYNLKGHQKVHEKPPTLKCLVKTCSKVFQTERERRLHCKMHDASEAPLKCTYSTCDKSFFTQAALQTHTRAHTYTESELKCSYANCGKVFHIPYRLKEHLRTHTGQRPYACKFEGCTWTFPTSSKLRRHQSTHIQDRKFHCTIGDCKKSFIRSEHLKDHTLSHIGQRSYECEVCGLNFASKSSLNVHNKKLHPDRRKEEIETTVGLDNKDNTNLVLPFHPFLRNNDKAPPNADVLLEQAIQSLDVVSSPTDLTMLGTSCLLPEDLLENDVNFSTVNLRDLD